MADPSPQARLERSPGVLWRQTLDGVLVLAPNRDEPVHISHPGDVLWRLLETRSTVDELVAGLSTLFDVDARVVSADIRPVLAVLSELGAVREASPPST